MASVGASKQVISTSYRWAIGGWAFFIAENVILSENRDFIINALDSDDMYHAIYGTFSTLAIGSVGYGYFQKGVRNAEPFAWKVTSRASGTPLHRLILAFCGYSLGLGMASQSAPKFQIPVANGDEGFKVRCPFDFTDSKDPNRNASMPHGIDRISRHPGLWSFGTVSAATGCLVPSIPQTLCLSMPLLVALVGGTHNDSRFRRGMGGTLSPQEDEITSNVPFLAMLTGKQDGGMLQSFNELLKELKLSNLGLAVGTSALLVLRKVR